jgi:catechol 2,3-dioxygenase-like lactoylglutathione lyase family enzyme
MTPSEQLPTRIIVVSVPVSDQDQAKSFYVERLGFDLVRDDDSVPGLRWIEVRPSGGAPSLTLVDWFESMPAGSMRGLVFAVDEITAEYERLMSNGVEFDSPPRRQPWAIEAVFRDPDGNQFVLQQSQPAGNRPTGESAGDCSATRAIAPQPTALAIASSPKRKSASRRHDDGSACASDRR